MVSPDALAGSDSPRAWRGVLDVYAEPRLGRSVLDLATSVVPYLALLVAMTFALRVSVWLSLVLVLPTSAFLIRTFIVFHDCAHGSFMRSRRAKTSSVSSWAVGVAPVPCWRTIMRPPCHLGRSRSPWRGRRRTLTVTEYHSTFPAAGRSRLPALPQPPRHVRLGWLVVLILTLAPRVPLGRAPGFATASCARTCARRDRRGALPGCSAGGTFLLVQCPRDLRSGSSGSAVLRPAPVRRYVLAGVGTGTTPMLRSRAART